jgi:cytochrome P450
VLNIDGDDHFERRRIEAKVFTQARLRDYEENVLEPYLERAFARVLEDGETSDGLPTVDLVPFVRGALVGVVAKVIGLDDVDTPERIAELETILEILHQGVKLDFRTDVTKDAAIAEVLECRSRFVERFFAPSWKRRTEALAAHAADPHHVPPPPADLLTVLQLHPEHTARWDDELPLREATLFAQASIGTTTRGVSHTVVELDRWVSGHPEDETLLTDEDFIGRAFVESLRLHPIDPALQRRAWEDCVLPSGTPVAKGEAVGLDLLASGTNPQLFGEDARTFDPHRKHPEGLDPHTHGFGGGPHKCTGFSFVTGDRAEEAIGRRGSAKTILLRLYEAGVRLDRQRPPIRDDGTAKDELRSVPVVFTALRELAPV